MRISRGFTLIEMIIAMVITGILSAVVAVFIAGPVRGYIDTARRAELTDMADLALKRMVLEIRTAVPNSLYLQGAGNPTSSTQWVEFIPAYAGGRYCTDTDSCPNPNGDLDFGAFDSGSSFDVLGPPVPVTANSFMVVYNTKQCSNAGCTGAIPCTGLDAYEGCNRRLVKTAATASSATLTFWDSPPAATDYPFPYASPSNRFQLVSSDGPVAFRCENNELRRHTGYGWTHAVPSSPAGALLSKADGLTCEFTYNTVSATNGLLTLKLTLEREGESITLYQQIHVDNMP
jgi:MSHA biogenesis protein MshO